MIDTKKYSKTYEEYDRMFNESMMVGLPEVEAEKLYDIMTKCIEAGKDAVEMGFSPGYAGSIKVTAEDGELSFWF